VSALRGVEDRLRLEVMKPCTAKLQRVLTGNVAEVIGEDIVVVSGGSQRQLRGSGAAPASAEGESRRQVQGVCSGIEGLNGQTRRTDAGSTVIEQKEIGVVSLECKGHLIGRVGRDGVTA